jgi:shikimate kinase
VDLDDEIVRREGRSIAAIFSDEGESHFRALEREATQSLRDAPASVVAPGGGWVTNPEAVALLCPPARMLYLKVSPVVAARRIRRTVHKRPLLRGDPVRALERMLGERQASYARADYVVDTELISRQEVTALVAALGAEGAPG